MIKKMKKLTKKEKRSLKQKEQAEAEASTFLDMTTLREVKGDDSEELSTDGEEFLPIKTITKSPRNEMLMQIWCVGKYFLWVPMLGITLLIIRLTGSSILCDDSEFLFPSNKDTHTPATTAAISTENTASGNIAASGPVTEDCEKCPEGRCERKDGKCNAFDNGYHCSLGDAGTPCKYMSDCFTYDDEQFYIWPKNHKADPKVDQCYNVVPELVESDCKSNEYGFNLKLKDSSASMYEIQLRAVSDDFFAYSITSTSANFEVLDLESGTGYIIRYRVLQGEKWNDFEKQQSYCITRSPDETIIRQFLAVSYTQTSMTVRWKSPEKEGVESYDLYKNGKKVGTVKDAKMTVTGLTVGKDYKFQVAARFGDGSTGAISNEFKFMIPRRSFTDVYRNSDEVDFLRDSNSANAEGFVGELASQSKSSAKKTITKYCLEIDGDYGDWVDCKSGKCQCKDKNCDSVGKKDLAEGSLFSTPKQIDCVENQLGDNCVFKASSMQYMVEYAALEKAGFKYKENEIGSNKLLLDKVFEDKILRCCGC